MVQVKQVLRIWFLPYAVPQYADSDGWLIREFGSEAEVYAWAEENDGLIDEAECALTKFKYVSSGSINREE